MLRKKCLSVARSGPGLLAVVWLGLAVPPAAGAVEPAEVEDLIRQGVELRRQSRNGAALSYFQRAYDLQRSPRTAAQLGMVEAALGYWLAAERHLAEALESPRHPWLVEHRTPIAETLESVRGFIGELEVAGAPAGAEVLANGQPAGRLPGPISLRMGEGPVKIEAAAAGHLTATQSVNVVGGDRRRVLFELEKDPSASSAALGAEPPLPAPRPSAPSPVARAAPPSVAQPPDAEAPAEPAATWIRPFAWTAAVASAMSLGLGTWGVIAQRQKRDAFDDYSVAGMPICRTDAPMRGGRACSLLYTEAGQRAQMAVLGLSVGGALAVGAAVAFFASRALPAVPLLAAGGPAGGALSWSGRF
jgi:hypothetical protein